MADPDALKFAHSAVDKGYITKAQMERMVEISNVLTRQGVKKTFVDICVSEGVMTDGQAHELYESLGLTRPVPTPATVLAPGYQYLKKLGEGGMGAVYMAKQLSIDRVVALKVLKKDLAQDADFVKRFVQEAKMAARLTHSNIVGAIDCGESNGDYYMVMEFVEGKSLDKLLEERKAPLPEKEALEIVRKVAEGLQYAWEQKVIHRDIKPQNIMITQGGQVKICDLGLCRDVKSDVRLTATGMITGTPAFASPEQGAGEKDLDTRSDIYSLGVTLYQLLTGKLPFSADNAMAILLMHAKDKPVPPLRVNPAISYPTNQLVLSMMEKDRRRRPQSPAELVKRIDDILSGRAPAKPPTIRQDAPPPAPPEEMKKGYNKPIVAVAAVIVLLVLLILIFGSGGSNPPRQARPNPSPRPNPTPAPAPIAAPTTLPRKALLVVTSAAPGCWVMEVAVPYQGFSQNGIHVDIASPKGGSAPVDPRSSGHRESAEFLASAGGDLMKSTLKLSDVNPANYALVLFCGGDGAIYDFPDDPDVQRIGAAVFEQGGIVSAVCRGPAALINIKLKNGKYLLEGQKVTAYTESPTGALPYDLGRRLQERGAEFQQRGWQGQLVVESANGHLVTAEHPPASRPLTQRLVHLLNNR